MICCQRLRTAALSRVIETNNSFPPVALVEFDWRRCGKRIHLPAIGLPSPFRFDRRLPSFFSSILLLLLFFFCFVPRDDGRYSADVKNLKWISGGHRNVSYRHLLRRPRSRRRWPDEKREREREREMEFTTAAMEISAGFQWRHISSHVLCVIRTSSKVSNPPKKPTLIKVSRYNIPGLVKPLPSEKNLDNSVPLGQTRHYLLETQ